MKNIFGNLSKIVITTGLVLSVFFVAGKVNASGCTPLYGGGVTCPRRGEILIDKQVRRADKDIFVDNLTEFDTKFSAEQEVVFRILVKNTGDDTIDEIQVKDIMPDFVTFISGPGNFDKNESKNGTLTFYINNLAPSETREYWIYGKIFATNDLPESVICKLQNRAQARASGDRFDEDVAELCSEKVGITKGGVPIKEIPKTGFEGALLTLASLSSILGAGFVLRRKAADYLR